MKNHFRPPNSPLGQVAPDPTSRALDWPSALLGAAVGVSGPAYFGTLITSTTMWLLAAQGQSVREIYAYIGQFHFTVPLVLTVAANVLCAIACGSVASASERRHPFSQGVAAGMMSASFPLIMMLSPANQSQPAGYAATELLIPLLGSVLGAFARSRRRSI